jgi:hypothetical protein
MALSTGDEAMVASGVGPQVHPDMIEAAMIFWVSIEEHEVPDSEG